LTPVRYTQVYLMTKWYYWRQWTTYWNKYLHR